ncbi:sugar phosphate isomerase/epimerase family protein [Paenibacillus sp. GCM10023248]|uniref:sugar phosphate isomerase/epimerase family protein n=1 Tax=Bacillales TaxID=1385 RepID=UPI002379544A|nr:MULTISPECIES: sugar phosphate isomerase/epimerase family protein [Bacillales]MDD9265626.1 sugar phosphate isomerase/epimerase [Paenibacillus sp. MAHUQ-63]MDR6878867.1 hexulose-6-phosphate isomerase [Bacillus sp. 3255]
MKKGINIWSFPGSMKVEACISVAKEAGFDGIELALNETGELSLESNESEIKRYRQVADEQGIELTSLASGLYWTYPITSAKAGTRQKSKDIVKKQLESAAILGVDTILVVPGAVGVDFIPDSEVVPYDQAYDYALEGISELAEVAESYKVSIGIENVWNKFLLSPLELRDFIDKINSPYVGSYFDVGNVVYAGYPEHWISILNKRIKKVHFKDYRRAAGGLHGFVDLLAGDVNYPEVVKALQAIGYEDYVIAEMIPGYTHHGQQIVFNTSGAMDAILGRK